jgi:two-component system chemotaxis response regulator CheY
MGFGMKVLLVDDSMTMRRIQRQQLSELGISEVVEASNGKEALEMVAANWPLDLMLLDWNMPEMDGLSCLKHLRQNQSYASMKVIMCTSESEKSRVMEAVQNGANNYIVKPFTPDVLKQRIGL